MYTVRKFLPQQGTWKYLITIFKILGKSLKNKFLDFHVEKSMPDLTNNFEQVFFLYR